MPFVSTEKPNSFFFVELNQRFRALTLYIAKEVMITTQYCYMRKYKSL